MSTAQNSQIDTTADLEAILDGDSHEHADGVKPPARVFVDGTEIPIINDGVRTEIRKDGAMGITHFSEVYFPAEWNGVDVASAVDALDPNATNVYDPVDVQYRDYVRDEYVTVHRGFVMGVGGAGRGDLERRMTVGDIGQLLGGMPISASYDAQTPYTTLIEAVIERMEQGGVIPNVVEDVEVAVGNLADQDNTVDDVVDPFSNTVADTAQAVTAGPLAAIVTNANLLGEAIGSFIQNNITRDTEFRPNQDTAADVLDWVASRVTDDEDGDAPFPRGIFYFEPADTDPTSSRVRLVFDVNPYAQFDALHLTEANQSADRRGEVQVFQNNALHEIRPVNQFTVNGAITDQTERSSIRSVRGYPTATAVHEKLADRARVPLEPPHYHADEATSIDEVESLAVEKLREELNEASLGTISTAPAPRLRPYSYIKSRPACGTDRETGVDPLNYEVESVVHRARAQTDRGERAHATTVRCSVPTSNITVDSEVVLVDQDVEYDADNLPVVGSP